MIALLTPSSQLVRRPYLCRVGRKLVDIEPGAFAANETDRLTELVFPVMCPLRLAGDASSVFRCLPAVQSVAQRASDEACLTESKCTLLPLRLLFP